MTFITLTETRKWVEIFHTNLDFRRGKLCPNAQWNNCDYVATEGPKEVTETTVH